MKKGHFIFLFLLVFTGAHAYDLDFEREIATESPLSYTIKNRENYESNWKSLGISFEDIFNKIALPCQLNPSPLDELHKK